MVDRNVRVRLSLDPHNFISGLGKSAFAAKAFAKSLDDGRISAFNKSLDDSRQSTSMLIRAGLALGPALIPTLAAATPAAFGLAAGLAAAATGGAVAALALNGVGDALGALNDYQLEPTAANLEKVQQAFEKLSPAAQEFVQFLDDAQPKLERLQAIAAEGALPGFQEGMDDLIDGMPVFGRLVGNTAEALGRLASDAGAAFKDDPFWQDFTNFIAREAGPALETYGRVFANFGKMVGGVIMAFDPLANDFNDSLLRMSERLAEWGTGLSGSRGFQDFTDYIRDVGPQVWETLGDIANALIQVVEAAAPLGGPTLQIIGGLANIIGAIADSPIGTVLIGVAAGLSAISSIKTLGQIASLQAIGALIKGGAKDGAAAGIGFKTAAAGVGIFALALTDLDDRLGVANTATLTLAGAMISKWGGAAGFIAGAALDAAQANDKLADSLDGIDQSLSDFDLQGAAAQLQDFSAAVDREFDEMNSIGMHDFAPGEFVDNLKSIFGDGEADEALDAYLERVKSLATISTMLNEFRHQLSGSDDPLAGYTTSLSELGETAQNIIPKLEAVGYTQQEIVRILTTGQGLDAAIAKVREYVAEQDSIPGRTQAVADAISNIGNEALSAADSAGELSAALEALFTPELNLSEATDTWIAGLKDLKNQIAETSGTLRGNSQAALQNREAIRGLVTNLIDLLNAQAAAGKGPEQLTKTLVNGRKQILDFADAAGLSRKQVAGLLHELGLTPKLVKIVMEANFTKREQEMARVREAINKLPKEVITRMTTPGAIQSRADVIALARELELTPNQKKILMSLIDNASGGIRGVIGLLNSVHDKTVTLRYNEYRTTFYQSVFEKGIGPGQSLYNADGNIIRNGRVLHFADGSEYHMAQIGRPGDMRIWNEPETGGEAYIPLSPSKRNRSLDIWARTGHLLGVPGFAAGDTIGGKTPLPDKRINEIVKRLTERFGKHSPIVDAIERWLQKVDKADFSQRELSRRIQELSRARANPLLRQFNVGPKQDKSETRSEVRELLSSLRETYGPDSRVVRMAERRTERLMDVAARQDKAARVHERAVDKFDRIQDRQRDFMQSVRQAFTHDAFAGEDIYSRRNSITQIRADANDAAKVIRQFRTLGRKGLDDSIIKQLAQSGNTALIRDLANSTPAQIRQYEQAFRRRQRTLRELGLVTGRQVFGDELHAQRRVVARTEKTLRHLDHTLNRLERRVERGVERGVRRGFRDRSRRQRSRRRAKAVR